MTKTISQRVATNLHRHRNKSGLTQQQVAGTVGVTIRTVQRWEAGTHQPRFDELLKLARLYGTTVPDFFAGAS